MLYEEYCAWVEYRNKHGSFNLSHHIERGAALIAMKVHNAHFKPSLNQVDLMPHYEEPQGTIEDVMKMLAGAK